MEKRKIIRFNLNLTENTKKLLEEQASKNQMRMNVYIQYLLMIEDKKSKEVQNENSN